MKNNVLKNMKKNNIIKILYKSISENISKQKNQYHKIFQMKIN